MMVKRLVARGIPRWQVAQCRRDLVHAAGCTFRGAARCVSIDCLSHQEPGDYTQGTRIPRSLRKYFEGRSRV